MPRHARAGGVLLTLAGEHEVSSTLTANQRPPNALLLLNSEDFSTLPILVRDAAP
jgi:hypothetical protein